MPDRFWGLCQNGLIGFAVVMALISAKPYAGSWNDGSRLASVEAFGEQGSFVIDESIFVKVPPAQASVPRPYSATPELLNQTGTLDKLLINGHFYSDKPPVMTVLLGSVYRLSLAIGGPTAVERPDLFCRWLTLLSAGLPFVLSVLAMKLLFQKLALPGKLATLLLLGFTCSTYAMTYTWYVNNHIVFLAVSAWLCLLLVRGYWTWSGSLATGTLAGFGYTLDLAIGPALLIALLLYMVLVRPRWQHWLLIAVAASPCLGLHHAVNYSIGGTIGPANAVPEYLNWPGSPFDARTMTGGLKHSPLQLVLYCLDMLFAKKGYISHDFPLFLFPASVILVWRYQREQRRTVAFVAVWFLLGFMAYAISSTNLSGACCSIRWFVPYLAPMFWIIALMLKDSPRYRIDLLWLTLIGLPFGILMWWQGPWTQWMVPGFWIWLGIAGLGWLSIRIWDYLRTPSIDVLAREKVLDL
jgi:hypothetical protein